MEERPLMDPTARTQAREPRRTQRSCALRCADSGYGIVVDKKFIKVDAKVRACQAALEKTEKDHLRVTVDGEMKDGVIAGTALTLD